MIQLFNKDCYDKLKEIEENSIDLICIDPQYGIGIADWDNAHPDWLFLFDEFWRILKGNGNFIAFSGWSGLPIFFEFYERYVMSNFDGKDLNQHFYLKNIITWDRVKGRGAKRNFVSTKEEIIWFVKNENYIFNPEDSTIKKKTKGMGEKNGSKYRRLSNVWTDISPIVPWSKEKLDHPTQKPLKLMERIIRVFSNENDTVLDCFMGSGTTGVASVNLKRKFIGIEKEEDYFKIAKARIENAKNNPTLF